MTSRRWVWLWLCWVVEEVSIEFDVVVVVRMAEMHETRNVLDDT